MTKLLDRFRDAALLRGNFTLRSGRTSDYYINAMDAFKFPSLLNDLADDVFNLFDERITCVTATGFGGTPLATTISSRHNLPLCCVRDKPKVYGTKSQIEGHTPTREDFIALVDGVFTTGGSLREATAILEEFHPASIEYAVILNRSEEQKPMLLDGEVKYLFSVADILE
ncbi:MAG: hypothetical protein IIA87_01805 [Nanoarchaeota archaeon]|nr:hypothetical protein [Nanoarchaeota archaeon]